MNKQPEALRLADELEAMFGTGDIDEQIVKELRRLHEVNQMLVEALENAAYYVPEKTGTKRLLEYALSKAKEKA